MRAYCYGTDSDRCREQTEQTTSARGSTGLGFTNAFQPTSLAVLRAKPAAVSIGVEIERDLLRAIERPGFSSTSPSQWLLMGGRVLVT